MKRFLLIAACLILAGCAAKHEPVAVEAAAGDFNRGWRFTKGDVPEAQQPGFDDSRWASVDLPHDWSIEGPFGRNNPSFSRGAWLPTGICYYRKTFSLPETAAGKDVLVYFGGIYRNSEVWINGAYLGRRPSGYASFFYDLTPHLQKTNVLTVKADNSAQPGSRWYSGTGIYRDVRLLVRDKLSIPPWNTVITTPVAEGDRAEVVITSTIANHHASPQSFVFAVSLVDRDGRTVAESSQPGALDPAKSADFSVRLAVAKPERWSPDSPYLYTARIALKRGEAIAHVEEISVGIRKMEFDAVRGFALNGHKLTLKGVCLHHDGGPLGAAVYPATIERQLGLMKKMGANAVRTAHNPMSDDFMDVCDRLGLLVLDEAFDEWQVAKAAGDYDEQGKRITNLMKYYAADFDEWAERDLADLVRRDRNHPSVFMWGLGNEIAQTQDRSGIAIAKKLNAIVHRYDDRPTTIACNGYPGMKNPSYAEVIESADVQGLNYPKTEQLAHEHQQWPNRKMIVTECASAQPKIERGEYNLAPDTVGAVADDGVETGSGKGKLRYLAYDSGIAAWQAVVENPNVMGCFIWTGMDYLGEVTPHPWPARVAFFGVVDLCGFPKDGFYYYQSIWSERPMLHLFPHWNWPGQEGKTIGVGCFSNCATVELTLNGKSVGRKNVSSKEVTVFDVPYESGVLKAIGYSDVGKRLVETVVRTAGAPAKVVLSTRPGVLKSDGRDLLYVECAVTDAAGTLVPDAKHLIQFKIAGPATIAGVDNGDHLSHESMKANERKAFNGRCLAIIKSGTQRGLVTFTASAPGLESAKLVVGVQ